MPFKDPEKRRAAGKITSAKYQKRKRQERYGTDAETDHRGRHGNHAKGKAHARWSDEKIFDGLGYVRVRVGRNHPLHHGGGYAYEHLLVWVSAGNPKPTKGFDLHHKNEDKTDNRLDNLEVLTKAEHARRHHQMRKQKGIINGTAESSNNIE